MTHPLFNRVLLPIVEDEDPELTCESVRPYVEAHVGELVVVTLTQAGEGELEGRVDDEPAWTADVFEVVHSQFADTAIPIRTETRFGTDIVAEMFDAAAEFDVTVIGVTPRSENDLINLLSGDDTHEAVEGADIPVVVFPPSNRRKPFRSETTEYPHGHDEEADTTVLVPVDGSALSLNALEHACSAHPEAEIVLLHVLEARGSGVYESMTGGPSSDGEEFEHRRQREVDRIFSEAEDVCADAGIEPTTLTLTGKVANAIITCADQRDIDQIVMGSRGRGGLTKALLGSVSETVIQGSSVPVTIIR